MKYLKLKPIFVWVCCLLLGSSLAFGQRQITGVVSDAESGEALIGASVRAKGSTAGAITDVEGKYRVAVPAGITQLEVSYTGYTTQTVEIGASNTIDVRLQAGVTLEETVVIGYGTVKKDDATGALLKVGTKDFNQGAIVAPQELLVGKVAGVVVTPSADPGGGGVIRIRGGSSLSASNDPLIVIDGVPVENQGIAGSRNALNIVNPNDIESFTVLKDASATAIYGSRASNGVIMITTKKGTLNRKIGVNLTSNLSFSNRLNQIDVMSAADYRALITERFSDTHPARALLGDANTDWQKEIFQTGVGQDHNLSLFGGVGNFPYRVSLGYTQRNGILKTDELSRLTGSVSLTPSFFDNHLQVNANLKYSSDDNRFGNRGAIGSAAFFDPTQPILDPTSKYNGYFTWTQANGDPIPIAPANPVALLELQKDKATVNRYIANAQLDYRFHFLPELRANLNVGIDKSNSDGSVHQPETASFAYVNKGLMREYTQEKKNELLEFYLNYVKPIGSTKLDLMGGYSWQHFFFEDYFFAHNLVATTDPDYKIFDPKTTRPREYYLVSLFGRLNYSIGDKYLFTFTVRRDGSSRFSEDNRWGLFPSAAFAYKLLERKSGNLNNLKLRLSYGETGQQDIGGDFYPYLSRYLASFNNAQYQFGNEFYTTLRPNGYDANIKWEQTATYNVGLDYGLFENRVYGSIEYYIRKTTDLINFIPVPAGTNLTNYITTNVGDLENRGVELSLNAVPFKRANASWEIGANLTLNKNKITKLTATDDPKYQGVFTGGIAGGVGNTIQVHSVGFPANSFFVYEQVYDDKGVPIEGLYVDRNGDGKVTPDDRYRYKKPTADAWVGFYTNFNWNKWDLAIGGRASIGNYVYNNIQSNQANYNDLYNSAGYVANTLSIIRDIDFAVPQYFSDHFIQNASFLRFDHITLGYTFDKLGFLKSLRLTGSIQNPLLVTQYKGLDPEVFSGIDGNIYPRSRTFMFGLNANF